MTKGAPRPRRRDTLLALGAAAALPPSWRRAEAGPPAATAPIVQPATRDPASFMARAMALRDLAVARGDQPYGAVVVRGDTIVGEGISEVVTAGDPTAHAEMQAIRDAARRLGRADLSGCELYGSSRACPMCEAAAYWARIARLRHGADGSDGGAPRLRG
jgi:tRNA(Arg) A34 adenosine deaminase TadA